MNSRELILGLLPQGGQPCTWGGKEDQAGVEDGELGLHSFNQQTHVQHLVCVTLLTEEWQPFDRNEEQQVRTYNPWNTAGIPPIPGALPSSPPNSCPSFFLHLLLPASLLFFCCWGPPSPHCPRSSFSAL